MMRTALLLAAALALSCSPSQVIVSRDVDGRVTVSHGVYGQTVIFGNEDGSDGPFALASYQYDVTSLGNSSATVPVVSDSVGFYQLSLDPGSYSICTTWSDCGSFTVPASGVVRFDYDFGTSLGWHVVVATAGPDAGSS